MENTADSLRNCYDEEHSSVVVTEFHRTRETWVSSFTWITMDRHLQSSS